MELEAVQDVFYSLIDVQKWVKFKRKGQDREELIGFAIEIIWDPESIVMWSMQSQVDSSECKKRFFAY